MSREEVVEMVINLDTNDIVSSGLIGLMLKTHPSFVDCSVPNKNDGKKYIIGTINNINIIVNPYQYYDDYKIENNSGEILLDLRDCGVDFELIKNIL